GTLSLPQLGFYVHTLSWGAREATGAQWEQVRARLHARFLAAADGHEQRGVAVLLLQVLDARQAKEQAIAFLREWLEAARSEPDDIARQLFPRLLTAPFSPAIEDEAFALVPRLLPESAKLPQRERIVAA